MKDKMFMVILRGNKCEGVFPSPRRVLTQKQRTQVNFGTTQLIDQKFVDSPQSYPHRQLVFTQQHGKSDLLGMSLPPPKSRSVSRAARKARPAGEPKSNTTVRHLGDRVLRIDSPKREKTPEIVSNPPVDLDVALAEMGFVVEHAATPETEMASPRDWLTYHASDLIDRLTQWSDDLTVREANLHAQQAMWDRQARRLRLQFQETQFELDEIEATLKQSHDGITEREEQLRVTARRLALASM